MTDTQMLIYLKGAIDMLAATPLSVEATNADYVVRALSSILYTHFIEKEEDT